MAEKKDHIMSYSLLGVGLWIHMGTTYERINSRSTRALMMAGIIMQSEPNLAKIMGECVIVWGTIGYKVQGVSLQGRAMSLLVIAVHIFLNPSSVHPLPFFLSFFLPRDV